MSEYIQAEGYMADSRGRPVPLDMARELDRLRDETIRGAGKVRREGREVSSAFRGSQSVVPRRASTSSQRTYRRAHNPLDGGEPRRNFDVD